MEPAFSVAVNGGGAKSASWSVGEERMLRFELAINLEISVFAGISRV
jgi:hypothetical protein